MFGPIGGEKGIFWWKKVYISAIKCVCLGLLVEKRVFSRSKKVYISVVNVYALAYG